MFTFSRRFFSKPFFLGDKHPRPFSLSATSPPLRLSILTALMRPSLFYTLDFIITRDFTSLLREIPTHCYSDYKSLLREITNHYYERLQIIITRDYKSLLREITNHYYERLQIIITRITTHCYSDYKSLLREITNHCYSDYKSLLREITNHYYERLHFII
jgi:hypothetical protein